MADSKSAKELTTEFIKQYETVRPTLDALNERLREIEKFFKKFRADNSFWNSKYGWLGDFIGGIGPNEILGDNDAFYFEELNYGQSDDQTLTFDEFDNFEAILEAEFIEKTTAGDEAVKAKAFARIEELTRIRAEADRELAELKAK